MTCKANQYCVTCQGLGKPSDTVQIWIGERGGTEEGGLGVRGGGKCEEKWDLVEEIKRGREERRVK